MSAMMFLLPFVACGLFGLWVGWVGGKAEGRAIERRDAESEYPSYLCACGCGCAPDQCRQLDQEPDA